MHIGYADRSGEVICQEQHLLETDLFEGVSVQSVACACACAWKAQWSAVSPQLLGSFFPLLIREKASATRVTSECERGRERGTEWCLHCKLPHPIQTEEMLKMLQGWFSPNF